MRAAAVGPQSRLTYVLSKETMRTVNSTSQHALIAVVCCLVPSRATLGLTIGEGDGLDGVG